MPKGLISPVIILLVAVLVGCASSSRLRIDAPPAMAAVLDRAQDLIGTPYCFSGSTPDCFDCSGFVGHCFAVTGRAMPRTSRDLFAAGRSVDLDELLAGDLVFFSTSNGPVNHVGIYLADAKFIHSSTSNGVMISSLNESYWRTRLKGARRVMIDG